MANLSIQSRMFNHLLRLKSDYWQSWFGGDRGPDGDQGQGDHHTSFLVTPDPLASLGDFGVGVGGGGSDGEQGAVVREAGQRPLTEDRLRALRLRQQRKRRRNRTEWMRSRRRRIQQPGFTRGGARLGSHRFRTKPTSPPLNFVSQATTMTTTTPVRPGCPSFTRTGGGRG